MSAKSGRLHGYGYLGNVERPTAAAAEAIKARTRCASCSRGRTAGRISGRIGNFVQESETRIGCWHTAGILGTYRGDWYLGSALDWLPRYSCARRNRRDRSLGRYRRPGRRWTGLGLCRRRTRRSACRGLCGRSGNPRLTNERGVDLRL